MESGSLFIDQIRNIVLFSNPEVGKTKEIEEFANHIVEKCKSKILQSANAGEHKCFTYFNIFNLEEHDFTLEDGQQIEKLVCNQLKKLGFTHPRLLQTFLYPKNLRESFGVNSRHLLIWFDWSWQSTDAL